MVKYFIAGSQSRQDNTAIIYRILVFDGELYNYYFLELYNNDSRIKNFEIVPPGLLEAIESYRLCYDGQYADLKLSTYLQKLGFNLE